MSAAWRGERGQDCSTKGGGGTHDVDHRPLDRACGQQGAHLLVVAHLALCCLHPAVHAVNGRVHNLSLTLHVVDTLTHGHGDKACCAKEFGQHDSAGDRGKRGRWVAGGGRVVSPPLAASIVRGVRGGRPARTNDVGTALGPRKCSVCAAKNRARKFDCSDHTPYLSIFTSTSSSSPDDPRWRRSMAGGCARCGTQVEHG